MKTRRVLAVLLLILLILVGTILALKTKADTNYDNVKPYVIANLPQETGPAVYKMVYQGCELFIVKSYWHTEAYAITTGRGCK